MSVFSSSAANFNMQVQLTFPYSVTANGGIKWEVAAGVGTLSLDYPTLTPNAGLSDPSLFTVAIYNTVSEAYEYVTLNSIPTTTTGDVRTPRGDAAYTILSSDRVVALTAALTAPRIWTLPAASALTGGTRIVILDEAGGIGSTNTLTIARAGADTINGATSWVLNAAYAGVELRSNGSNRWSVRLLNTADLIANAVTDAKLRQSAALSVIGRSANSTGDVADIAAGTDGFVLRRSGTTLGFGTVATAGIADSAVTTAKILDANVTTAKVADNAIPNAKLAQMATATVKANITGGTADPADVTYAQLRSALGVLAHATPTAITTNSGASHDFTGIPAGCKRIVVSFDGVSINATGEIIIQLGDSGGIETSGYVGSWGFLNNAAASGEGDLSTGFSVGGGPGGAAGAIYGSVELVLHNPLTNTWTASGVTGFGPTSTVVGLVGGSKTLSATLDRVRLTTVAGTPTFDNGTFAINYFYA